MLVVVVQVKVSHQRWKNKCISQILQFSGDDLRSSDMFHIPEQVVDQVRSSHLGFPHRSAFGDHCGVHYFNGFYGLEQAVIQGGRNITDWVVGCDMGDGITGLALWPMVDSYGGFKR